MYKPMIVHDYCSAVPPEGQFVWPFPPPPVYYGNWDSYDWNRYILSYRPKDYQGGDTDKAAWKEYVQNKQLEHMQKQWPNLIVTRVGDDMYNFKRRD